MAYDINDKQKHPEFKLKTQDHASGKQHPGCKDKSETPLLYVAKCTIHVTKTCDIRWRPRPMYC